MASGPTIMQMDGVYHTCPRERSAPFPRKYQLGGTLDKRPTFYGIEDSSTCCRFLCLPSNDYEYSIELKDFNDVTLINVKHEGACLTNDRCARANPNFIRDHNCLARWLGKTVCIPCCSYTFTVTDPSGAPVGEVKADSSKVPCLFPTGKEYPFVSIYDAQGKSIYEMRNITTRCCSCDGCKVSWNNCIVGCKRTLSCANCRRENFEFHFPVNGGEGEGTANDVMTEVVAKGEHCYTFIAPDSEWHIRFPPKANTAEHRLLLATLPMFVQHYGWGLAGRLQIQGFMIPNVDQPDDKLYFSKRMYTYSVQ